MSLTLAGRLFHSVGAAIWNDLHRVIAISLYPDERKNYHVVQTNVSRNANGVTIVTPKAAKIFMGVTI